MARFLYTLIIYPLAQIIEFAFTLCDDIFSDEGLAVIGVSMAVSILCLPLYIVAEKWQQIQRDTEKSLEKGVARIKETFKGDERYMMLSTFYRQRSYHPLMALRSSFGLLIQIPFFIAAYSFLSNLPALRGEGFLFIKDMGAEDAIFKIGNFPVNVLPLAMTAINIAAGAIYTKGFKFKDKISIYAMALVFLVILYRSPSGLVLYWTMNNVFSLVKNVFYKIKNPRKVLCVLLFVAILALDFFVLFVHNGLLQRRAAFAAVVSLLLFAPLASRALSRLLDGALSPLVKDSRARLSTFALSCAALAALSGFVIPSFVVSSSPVEFCGIDGIKNPLFFLFNSTLQASGFFVFWALCVYFLFGARVQAAMAALMPSILLAALVDAFAFSGEYGTLSRLITFDAEVPPPAAPIAIANIACAALAFFVPLACEKFRKPKILSAILSIALIAECSLSVAHTAKIQKGFLDWRENSEAVVSENDSIKSVYHFTKTGRNVVVLMTDRAENAYALPIFEEFPELREEFSGFTLYRNVVSFNAWTLMAAPPLYGGYEYTPAEMNKRGAERLVDKHNESLLLLPRVFTEQSDFTATVSDLSWANYSWIPDMRITEPYPKITGLNVERKYTALWMKRNPAKVKENITSDTLKRNLLWFSFFKCAPMALRDVVYDDGLWWSADDQMTDVMEFIDYYAALDFLPELTDFSAQGDSYFTIVNETTHSEQALQPPDYAPAMEITESAPRALKGARGMCSNIAMYKRVAEWLKVLKANGCYDNTRIIIVADHGVGSSDGDKFDFDGKSNEWNIDHFHPLLMVKDFGAAAPLAVNYDFMTNADVPALALKGVVDNPVNPFTMRPIEEIPPDKKKASGVVLTHAWQPGAHGINEYKVPEKDWMTVSENMMDEKNWREGIH